MSTGGDGLDAEIEHHERLYSGQAQALFAKGAVRAFRAHLVRRILAQTGAGPRSRVLSIGCGIGDTELLLAGHVREVVGIDISKRGIEQARADAIGRDVANASFIEGTVEDLPRSHFDVVLAIFFLHHLADSALEAFPRKMWDLLTERGIFYALDPNRLRLSGAVGSIVVPHLMRKYQSPGERRLDPARTAGIFARAGFSVHAKLYDFGSTPLAGLFPAWRLGYQAARTLDDALLRVPLLRKLGSNFELVARRPV